MGPARVGVLALAVALAACAPAAVIAPSPVRGGREPSPERLRAVVDGVVPRIAVLQAMAGHPPTVPRDDERLVMTEGSRHPGPPPLLVVDGRRLRRGAPGVKPALIAGIKILRAPEAVERFGPDAAYGAVLIRTRRK